jgi:hypothetical protein
MGWNGDISRMGKLADRIADLAAVPSRAARRVAESIEELVQEEFDEAHDPYGKPFAPLADATLDKRSGPMPPGLDDKGSMRSSLRVVPMRGAGVSITIDHPAQAHQTGWSGPVGSGPARPLLPSRKMPEAWKDAIEDAVDTEVRSTMGRR